MGDRLTAGQLRDLADVLLRECSPFMRRGGLVGDVEHLESALRKEADAREAEGKCPTCGSRAFVHACSIAPADAPTREDWACLASCGIVTSESRRAFPAAEKSDRAIREAARRLASGEWELRRPDGTRP